MTRRTPAALGTRAPDGPAPGPTRGDVHRLRIGATGPHPGPGLGTWPQPGGSPAAAQLRAVSCFFAYVATGAKWQQMARSPRQTPHRTTGERCRLTPSAYRS